MPEKRIYKPLPNVTREQVTIDIETNNIEHLIYAAFAIATYDTDWKYAQDVCIRLTDHPDTTVRGNAVLALAYVARIHRRLEKQIVKPILLRALNDHEDEVHNRAEDAIQDINHYMNWRIGNKCRSRTMAHQQTTNDASEEQGPEPKQSKLTKPSNK